MAGVSSQGTTFTFNGSTFAATSIRVSNGQSRRLVGGAHMGMAVNDFEPVYRTHRTEEERVTVDIEYVAGTTPAINATGSLTIAGRISVSGQATCVSSEVTAAVGELLRGTASFRMA
jgi:hypothetical protein